MKPTAILLTLLLIFSLLSSGQVNEYPEIKYFVVWHNWTGVKMALNTNLFAKELMNDPWIITRYELNLIK